jgi:hypothetical protein
MLIGSQHNSDDLMSRNIKDISERQDKYLERRRADKQEVVKQVGYDIPTKNPLKFIEKWINMDMNQGSPMEQKTTGQYLINAVRDTAGDKIFEADF